MSQSETPLETVTTTPATSVADDKPAEKISLAELFKETPEQDSSVEDSSVPIESIDGVAKRLKLTPEQVYALKVPMKDNAEPLTIGALKDRVSELVDLDTRELMFDQRRVKQEGELLRSQAEIRELLSMIPKESIAPALVKKLREQHEQMIAHEHKAVLELIPEWNDETKRTPEVAGMIEHLSEYGFPESFLETVSDHRALKYIRDNYLRDKRIKDALARVSTPVKKGAARPSAKAGSPAKPISNSPSNRQRGTPDMRANLMALFKTSE